MAVERLLKRFFWAIILFVSLNMAITVGCTEKPPNPKINYYLQQVKTEPGNPIHYTNLGWTLYKDGNLPEALRWNEKALQINANNNTARYNLALIYFDQQDFQKSRRELELILKSQPSDPLALLKLGEVNLKLNKFEEARQAFKPI